MDAPVTSNAAEVDHVVEGGDTGFQFLTTETEIVTNVEGGFDFLTSSSPTVETEIVGATEEEEEAGFTPLED